MKKLLSILTLVAIVITSCDKADVTAVERQPHLLNIAEMVSYIGKSYSSVEPAFMLDNAVVTDSANVKIITVSLLDKESPNPNFIGKMIETNGTINKIIIKATEGSHGTFKNTFYYFDKLLSTKYALEKFYAIDADGGINSNSKTREELYNYLTYNTSSGAAIEFKTPGTKILNFCFNESEKAFELSIDDLTAGTIKL